MAFSMAIGYLIFTRLGHILAQWWESQVGSIPNWGICRLADQYYQDHPKERNKMAELRPLLYRNEPIEKLLEEAFDTRKANYSTSFTLNNYYSRYGDKYFSEGQSDPSKDQNKTPRLQQ